MKKVFQHSKLLAAVLLAALVQPMSLHACAVCYGEPDSPMSRGLTWAITSLAVIVFVVLAGVVTFFVQASRRATAGDQTATAVNRDTQ